MVMVRNPKPYKWFIYGYGLVGQNIRPCTPLYLAHTPTVKVISGLLAVRDNRIPIMLLYML